MRGAPVNRLLLGGLLLAGLGGCTAADNLSYDDLVYELDAIVAVEGADEQRAIVYRDHAATSNWYMRQFWLGPLRWPLGWTFGKRSSGELKSPVRHVRELLVELPDEAGGDRQANVQLGLRVAWLAAFDQNSANRVIALDVLAEVAQRLALPVLPAPAEALLVPLEAATAAAAQATLAQHAAGLRGETVLAADERAASLQALQVVVAAPLSGLAPRLQLAQQLALLQYEAVDAELAAAADAALQAALTHVVRGVLIDLCRSRAADLSEVRLCAIEHFRRLGGPASVPLLVALTTATPEQIRRGEDRFEPDPLVRLRLLSYAGQLRGELAQQQVLLPGVEAWATLSPAEFLAQTILNEQSYYSRLRVPALKTLSLSLERPTFDYDVAWVRAWLEERSRVAPR